MGAVEVREEVRGARHLGAVVAISLQVGHLQVAMLRTPQRKHANERMCMMDALCGLVVESGAGLH